MSANVSGICGVVGKSCQKSDLEKIANGMHVTKHAQNREMYLDDSIGLYSFCSKSNENKVVHNEEETILAIITGEIYNAEKVRLFLESHGHNFASNINHEVLVHVFEDLHENPLLIHSLEGAFSFAIWDRVNQRLMLGVDKFGTRPLYYTSFDGSLLFASEMRGIANYSETLKKLNVTSIDLFFSYYFVPTEDTLVAGVKKLLPATYKIFKIQERSLILLKDVDYFDLGFSRSTLNSDIDLLCEKVHDSILTSAQKKVKDESLVGVSLGGGIDSGLVSSLLRKLDKEVVAFVIAVEGGEQNEARLTTEFNGCIYDEIFVTDEEYVKNFENVVHALDEPIFCWSLVPSYLVIQRAKKQVGMLFTGDGSDTIFWGMPPVPRYWFEPFLTATPSTLRKIADLWVNKKGIPHIMNKPVHRGRSVNNAYERVSLPASHMFFLDYLRKFDQSDLASILNRFRARRSVANEKTLATPVDKCFKEVPINDDLVKRYYTMLRIVWPFAGMSVRPRESFCNYFGIRYATPFVDEEVVRLASSIPSNLKQPSRYTTKYILRRMVSRYKLLPPEILKKYSKRHLADLPMTTWLNRGKYVRDFVFETLDEGCSLGLIGRDFVKRIKNGTVTPYKYFALMMFILWYKDFVLGGR